MSDVLITPASSKIEFKDASDNIDGIIQLDGDGNLELTSPGGGISFGDVSSDVFIGNGTDNVDILFEANGSITGTSGITLTLGSSASNLTIASDLTINEDVTLSSSSTITLNSDGVNPVIKIDGGGPNYIRFASGVSGTVDAASIDLVYRASPNTLGFERSTDGATLFSIDADNARATFGENIVVSGTVDGRDIATDGTKLDGIAVGATNNGSGNLSSYLPLSGGTITGNITVNENISLLTNKYIGYSNTYNYKPRATGGIGTRSELISNANFLIHADVDGSGTAEFVTIRAGAGTANELKILSKTSAQSQSSSALSFNGGQVWHAGNDGSGSGLDADTLDGIGSGGFLRSNANDDYGGGTLMINSHSQNGSYQGWGIKYTNSNWRHTNNNSYGYAFRNNATSMSIKVSKEAGTADSVASFNEFYFSGESTAYIKVGSNTVWHAGNDGSGSGLDADTLDGQQGSYYWNSGSTGLEGTHRITSTSDFNNSLPSGFYQSNTASNMPATNWHNMINVRHSSTSNDHGFQLSMSYYNEHLYSRSYSSGSNNDDGTFTTWAKQWSDRNDGAGSGLDADTCDGIQASSFLRSDADDTMTGALTIDVDNKQNGALRILANQTAAKDQDFYFAQEITSELSGSATFTGDMEQGGIYINIDASTTGGGTSHEHRAYGMYIDVDVTGDSDASYGIYADSTATPSAGTVTNVTGIYGRGEDNGGAGSVSTVMGVRGEAISDNSTSDINNMYGGYFRSTNIADTGNIAAAHGCYGEIEIPNNTGDHYVKMYVFRAEFDDNDEVAQSGESYLYYGNYAGTKPTTAYGVYINDNVESYFAGPIVSAQNITAFSDITLKKNIEVIPNALDKVSQIRGVTFDRVDTEDEPRQSGVIAQEVEKVLPEVVRTVQDGTKTVAYGNMVGLLIEAIKEQQQQIDDLKQQIKNMRGDN